MNARPLSEPEPVAVDVVGVRVIAGYTLELAFSDGEVRVIDMEPRLWGPVFEPLRDDYRYFCEVRVDPDSGTIVWPNGADWNPADLYEHSTPTRRPD